jgi:hypothetical protein
VWQILKEDLQDLDFKLAWKALKDEFAALDALLTLRVPHQRYRKLGWYRILRDYVQTRAAHHKCLLKKWKM